MRTIKFRAWDGKRFYTPILYDGRVFRNDRDYEDGIDFTDPLTQYTGLKDDTGKEIFEGDIVQLHDTFETKTGYLSQVYFSPYWGAQVDHHPAHKKMGECGRRDLYHYCSYGICEETSCDCIVVGNVFETPGLLEDGTGYMRIWDILQAVNAFPAYGEARRMFYQGGVCLDGEIVRLHRYPVLDGKHEIKVGNRTIFYVDVKGGKLIGYERNQSAA